jgi:hypothetical protein
VPVLLSSAGMNLFCVLTSPPKFCTDNSWRWSPMNTRTSLHKKQIRELLYRLLYWAAWMDFVIEYCTKNDAIFLYTNQQYIGLRKKIQKQSKKHVKKLLTQSSIFLWKQRASSGPTHKRTEGRAPVWGSEFTSKAAKRLDCFNTNPSGTEANAAGRS